MLAKVTRREAERAARMYKTNKEASEALGVVMQVFGRICRRYGIETPHARKRRRQAEARQGSRG